ncbi:MAG: glucose-6-phosphate isomerase [Prevotellaceae bacterium]|jgi:glucose-6-phosphate isomerase|nr:glucose-6-phosphate isomerase [Prevotellaceae bacterium]
MKLSVKNIHNFVSEDEILALKADAEQSLKMLHNKTGCGNDFLGWVNLPSQISQSDVDDIQATADKLSKLADVVIVIGIGGSYLGAKSVIEALSHSFGYLQTERKHPAVIFAGQNISEDYAFELLETIKGHRVAAVVISKSGTTIEPAITFRLIKKYIEDACGIEAARERIIAVTDKARGAMNTIAQKHGYKMFAIPDDVGGRFSVLTPVGLLPVAIAGFDIKKLVEGAADMEKATDASTAFEQNQACIYAAARNALYRKGKNIEILANFNPKLHSFAEWWKQLYGESEGKNGKGIFPASVNFTTDLHSLGQYIQDGKRMLFETVLSVESPKHKLTVPADEENIDDLNFIANKRIDEINKCAEEGTVLAHIDGGVPNIHISIPEISEYNLGQLIYFFEKACGISGYMLGVNPFDQPGVEAYKKNMFRLLGK